MLLLDFLKFCFYSIPMYFDLFITHSYYSATIRTFGSGGECCYNRIAEHCSYFHSIFFHIRRHSVWCHPLMRAIQFQMVEQAAAIIRRGADFTAETTHGTTAIDLAAAEPAMQRQWQVTN